MSLPVILYITKMEQHMMKFKKGFYLAMVLIFTMSLLQGGRAWTNNVKASQLSDGYYEIQAKLVHASIKEQPSMGDAAIEKPIGVMVKNGKLNLKIKFTSLTIKLGNTKYLGYLGELNYLTYSDDDVPTGNEAIYPTAVDEYYDVYDEFNNPEDGQDKYMMSLEEKRYPKQLSMPVESGDEEIWVQVYVPVMEAINAGGGRQYARLQLNWNSLKKVRDLDDDEKQKVETSELLSMINRAKSCLKQTDTYKTESLLDLQEKMFTAQDVLKNSNSTQKEIDAKTEILRYAIGHLKKKDTKSNTNNTVKKNTNKKTKKSTLNKDKLANGTYVIEGKMVKTDKASPSMSNEAINHNIKLTVKNNKYYITMKFSGMAVGNQFGYLGELRYFKEGYKIDKYGNPTGATGKTEIVKYQTESNGNKIKDNYGTNYPKEVTFLLIKNALNDGYVPLQVFVPIMEGISKGTGTQPVFLKLNWDTIEKANKNDSRFTKDDNSEKNSGTDNQATNVQNSILNAVSSLTSEMESTTGEEETRAELTENVQNNNNTLQNTTENTEDTNTQYVSTSSKESNGGRTSSIVISLLAVIAGITYKVRSRI